MVDTSTVTANCLALRVMPRIVSENCSKLSPEYTGRRTTRSKIAIYARQGSVNSMQPESSQRKERKAAANREELDEALRWGGKSIHAFFPATIC